MAKTKILDMNRLQLYDQNIKNYIKQKIKTITYSIATTAANGLMSKEMVQKLGKIDGITSDINSESDTIAASSKMVHDLYSNLSELSGGIPAIDTNNKLATVCNSSGSASTYTYTATQNCCVCGMARLWGKGSANIYIDDILILSVGGGDNSYGAFYPVCLYLKTKQVFKIQFTSINNGTNNINVYRLL